MSASTGTSTDKLPYNYWEKVIQLKDAQKDAAFDHRVEVANHVGI